MVREAPLHFSIEESVWLRNGQRIQDILSISLEPDITVEEHREYVSVRGTLELEGEFTPEEAPEDDDAFEASSSYRTLQQVDVREDGTAEFYHRFPVDVSIPISRVEDFDNIYVEVASFDYLLPEQQCIQLSADLAITGVKANPIQADAHEQAARTEQNKEEGQEAPSVEREAHEQTQSAEEAVREDEPVHAASNRAEDKEPDELVDAFMRQEEQTFTFETKREAFHNEEDNLVRQGRPSDQQEDPSTTERISASEAESELSQETLAIDEQPETNRQERIEYDETSSETDDCLSREEENGEKASVTSLLGDDHGEAGVGESKTDRDDETNLDDRVTQGVEMAHEEAELEVKSANDRDEGAFDLMALLMGDEKEQFSRLRLRIIQPGETLSAVAERYDISESVLARINRLDEGDVSEGEILYIPVAKQ